MQMIRAQMTGNCKLILHISDNNILQEIFALLPGAQQAPLVIQTAPIQTSNIQQSHQQPPQSNQQGHIV